MGKQSTLRLGAQGGEGGLSEENVEGQSRSGELGDDDDATHATSREEGLGGFNDEDAPLTWAEVFLRNCLWCVHEVQMSNMSECTLTVPYRNPYDSQVTLHSCGCVAPSRKECVVNGQASNASSN